MGRRSSKLRPRTPFRTREAHDASRLNLQTVAGASCSQTSSSRRPKTLDKSRRLYCLLDLGYTRPEDAETVAAALLSGGADLLQLRAKGQPLDLIASVARRLIPLCRAAGVPFILNDFPALAGELDADGVHIGQDDGSLENARALFNSSKSAIRNPQSPILFGRSTHSLAQAEAALAEGFDYIGFGPLFPTPTKAGRPGIGLADIAEMERRVGSRIPAFCIGGIKRSNLPEVLAAGARRVVIVSDLLSAPDVEVATHEVICSMKNFLTPRRYDATD